MLADEEGNHAFAVDGRAARGQRRRGRSPPACSTDRRVRVAAVIGSPGRALAVAGAPPRGVRRRRARLGATWRSTSRRARRGAALDAMRTLGLGGLSVTTPHKEEVAAAVDELAPAAAALRSVNTVVARRDGRLVGHSTDGDGFVDVARRRRRRRRRRPRRGASAPAPRPAASSTPSAGPAPPTSSSSTGRGERGRGGRGAGAGRAGSATLDDVGAGRHRRQRHVGRDGHRPTLPLDPALLRPRPGRRRPRLPPARDGAAARRPRRAGCRPSTASACSSTRPSSSRSCGPACAPTPP